MLRGGYAAGGDPAPAFELRWSEARLCSPFPIALLASRSSVNRQWQWTDRFSHALSRGPRILSPPPESSLEVYPDRRYFY